MGKWINPFYYSGFPIIVNTISKGLSILHFKGSWVEVSKQRCISVPEGYLYLTNSVDPDEMQHDAAFHLNLHCLPKYPFSGVPAYKRLMF